MQYEPELFPGLIYRMKQPKIVLLIFVSGKIVITGAKVIRLGLYSSFMDTHGILLILFVWVSQVRDETYTAFENIYPVLTEFRKNQQW